LRLNDAQVVLAKSSLWGNIADGIIHESIVTWLITYRTVYNLALIASWALAIAAIVLPWEKSLKVKLPLNLQRLIVTDPEIGLSIRDALMTKALPDSFNVFALRIDVCCQGTAYAMRRIGLRI